MGPRLVLRRLRSSDLAPLERLTWLDCERRYAGEAELVGIAQCALRRCGGWIGSLGVLPERRRRGLEKELRP